MLEPRMRQSSPRKLCIVDAYGSGGGLAAEFVSRGHTLVHVQTTPEIPPVCARAFRPELFATTIVAAADLNATAQALREHAPACVIAGFETGTIVADFLADALMLPGSSPQTSLFRRDKYQMGEAVRNAGLAAVRQARASTMQDAITIARDWRVFPLVVKPLSSAGGDCVQFCDDEAQLRRAVEAVLGKPNRFGEANEGVLLQERLLGQQFIVNAVSRQKRHHVIEIWRDDRIEVPGAFTIFDREVLLAPSGEPQDTLKHYACDVLDALGVKEGPSHGEFMLTVNGPVLIEVGSRLQGGLFSPALEAALGESQITHTANYCLDPDGFERGMESGYRLLKNMSVVNLIATAAGLLEKNQCDELFATLPSFVARFGGPQPGDRIYKTIDLWTKPGHVFLVHESHDQLEADYRQIRAWEQAGRLFKLREVA